MRLVILGAESIGREVAEIAGGSGYDAIEFLDDAPALGDVGAMGRRVIGGFDAARRLVGDSTDFFVAVGSIGTRERWMKAVRDAGGRLATLVHPGACVSSFATVGANTMIDFGCHIGPNVVMGEGNLLWSSVVISHDCTVGNHCFFGPTAACGGYTHIGDRSFIGCGAKLRSCIRVGRRVVIGMAATVTHSVPDDHFVAPGAGPVPIEGKDHEALFFGKTRTLPRTTE